MENSARDSWISKVGQPGVEAATQSKWGTGEASHLQGLLAPRLSAYFQHYTQAADLAEDLLAEAMLTAWNLWPTYNPEEQSITVWAFTIAQRVLRRRSIEPGPFQPSPSRDGAKAPDLAPCPAKPAPAAAGVHHTGSKRLSRAQREILALKLGGGLGDQEIAQVTGLRQAHVHLIVRRALEAIGLGPEPPQGTG